MSSDFFKSSARFLIKSLPSNKALFLVLKKISISDKVSKYLNFEGREYKVRVGQKHISFFSNGLIQDNRLFWRGIDYGEKYTMKLWQILCKENHTIIDIGANLGIFALVAKCINPEAEVHGFEPVPSTYNFFKKNVNANGFNIKCHELALSNTDGSAQIFTDGDNNLTPSLNKGGTGTTIAINVRTLDAFVREKGIVKIDLLKIDVETFEPEVLEGMLQIIEMNRPTMIIEVLNNEIGTRVQSLLDGKGYLYFYIDEEKGLIFSEKIVRLGKSRNYFICQNMVAERLTNMIFEDSAGISLN